jgi:hypothetical protein
VRPVERRWSTSAQQRDDRSVIDHYRLEAYATLLSESPALHCTHSATSSRVDALERLLYRDDFEVFFTPRHCIRLNMGIECRKTTGSFRCQTKQIGEPSRSDPFLFS